MKPSYYNIFVPSSNEKFQILVNSISRTACEVPNELVESIRSNNPIPIPFASALKEIGVLVEDPSQQRQLSFESFLTEKNNSKELSLVIPLTSKCNLSCSYCYQVIHGDFQGETAADLPAWDDETVGTLLSFVEKQLREKSFETIKVRWYGGEPLLKISLIKTIATKIKELAHQYGVRFVSQLISNGVLLSERNAEILRDCNVDRVEISLDGPSFTHDSLRHSRNGKSTYERVLNSILLSPRFFHTTVFRVNVHVDNVSHIEEWLSSVVNLVKDQRIFLKFKLVEGAKDNSLTFEEFSLWVLKYHRTAKKLGIKILQDKLETETCPAIKRNYFIIQSDLRVYKCPQNLGSANQVGVLEKDGYFNENWRLHHWIDYDVAHDADCKTCSHLPHCNGGCPYNQIMENIDAASLSVYHRKERCCHEKIHPEHLLIKAI